MIFEIDLFYIMKYSRYWLNYYTLKHWISVIRYQVLNVRTLAIISIIKNNAVMKLRPAGIAAHVLGLY